MKTHSIRFKFILFITAILLVLILLLNLYPVASSRGTMFQEKRSSLTSQASAVSAALAGPVPLEKEEVSRIIGALDLNNFHKFSQEKVIVPILVATNYSDASSVIQMSVYDDRVVNPLVTGEANLFNLIESVLRNFPNETRDCIAVSPIHMGVDCYDCIFVSG